MRGLRRALNGREDGSATSPPWGNSDCYTARDGSGLTTPPPPWGARPRARLPPRGQHKCTQTVSEILDNAKNAQTETWFAVPFNDISTVHVFERLPMKGPHELPGSRADEVSKPINH